MELDEDGVPSLECVGYVLRGDDVEALARLVLVDHINEDVRYWFRTLNSGPRIYTSYLPWLAWALDEGAHACILWLLQHGADPNIRVKVVESVYGPGRIVPVIAREAVAHRLANVDLLLQWGAKLELEPYDWTRVRHRHPFFDPTYLSDMVSQLLQRMVRLPDRLHPELPGDVGRAVYVLERRAQVCSAACTVLLSRRVLPISKDVKRWFVRRFVWATRRRGVWSIVSPDMDMPPGFE